MTDFIQMVAGAEGKLDALSARVNGLSAAVTNVSAQLEELGKRVNQVEGELVYAEVKATLPSAPIDPKYATRADMHRYSQNMVNLYLEWKMFGGHILKEANPQVMAYLDDTVKGLKEVMDQGVNELADKLGLE